MKIEEIDISHPDKPIFPDSEINKLDLVRYYEKIADKMLPYLKDRPLTLQRFPDGIDSDGFYQKNSADYFPDFIESISIETKEGRNTQVICNDKKTLIYLANQGVITFHIWLSKKEDLHTPDKVIFDLDPPKDAFEKVKEATQKIGDFLQKEGKNPHVMTTGKSGFHVWYDIRRTKDFDERREEAKSLAKNMKEKHPEILTTATRKDNRDNKVFIDYLRNAYGQTSVCPYSLRPIPSAGVATPLDWEELSKIEKPDQYSFSNIFRRLGQKA
ncbi:non-homologous end-joining DNA ligase [Psychroflexus sediminis]|uniref:Bifunctional non-homologous end joining protein LigD n=1 Tax=Psychroflexus sediminis TaxID=470826 RepID=A0A1G7W7Z6_9FLAO|nr:non-homologous end-joining DNA ligase [Psychroflexus sediminis]SDG68077.1 bifunctional non-homologous end joining protein LigD [Psychroflexus sediminis]